ncbi:hypothetical protein D3C85_1791990 [compost metagenome]
MLAHLTPRQHGGAYVLNIYLVQQFHSVSLAGVTIDLNHLAAVACPDNTAILKKRPRVVVQPDNSGLQKKAAYHGS